MRESHGGNQSNVRFGPTGTSKILFAIRPNSFIPWDELMRSHFHFDGSAEDYVKFLHQVRSNLEELDEACNKLRYGILDLPKLVNKPNSRLTKLMDEFHWVTITRKCNPPTYQELKRWIEWLELWIFLKYGYTSTTTNKRRKLWQKLSKCHEMMQKRGGRKQIAIVLDVPGNGIDSYVLLRVASTLSHATIGFKGVDCYLL